MEEQDKSHGMHSLDRLILDAALALFVFDRAVLGLDLFELLLSQFPLWQNRPGGSGAACKAQ